MLTTTIIPVPAFKDNYIWLLVCREQAKVACVDPGEADAVLAYCHTEGLALSDILITHHHWDHTGGVEKLLQHHSPTCWWPKNLKDLQNIELAFGEQFRVLTTPGHTLDHISYVGSQSLFCGDTLFSAGCGRLFEGSAEQMYTSLMRLYALPDETPVYCAHEYTLANLRFAQSVEPDNLAIPAYMQATEVALQQQRPTLPSTIKREKALNPFLRCHVASVHQSAERHANKILNTPTEVFAVIRQWKDQF